MTSLSLPTHSEKSAASCTASREIYLNISIRPAKKNLSNNHTSENFSKHIKSAAPHFQL